MQFNEQLRQNFTDKHLVCLKHLRHAIEVHKECRIVKPLKMISNHMLSNSLSMKFFAAT